MNRQRLAAAAIGAAIALLAGILELREQSERFETARAYQTREVQETISALHRDLLTVNHLGDVKDHGNEAEDYLAARREAFAAVRWLGYTSPSGGRPRLLLSSSDTRGYDPARDPAVVRAQAALREGDVAAALPSSHRNLAALALVLAADAPGEPALVALVDGDDLLDDSLRAQGPDLPMRLLWDGVAVAQWPHAGSPRWDGAPIVALPVAAMEFQVQFAYPDWKQRLIRLSPVPLLVLLAGLAAAAILGRHPLPAPPPPARLPFRPADATVPTATVLRDRLWRLGDLTATLSHDLGQPLNIIRLTAESAADALDSGRVDAERLRHGLGTVMAQTQRAQAMMDAVVAAARRPAALPVAFPAVECVRRALAAQLPTLRAHGLRLTWHAPTDLPPVRGHAHRLEAAVRHLLVNSCEALIARRLEDGGGGALRVECRADADGVVIEIADDGPGFPPALRAALDDPFAPPPTSGKGIGLGLTIAQGVVAEMGGRLRVADAPGGGARVLLTLPARPQSLLLVEDETAAAEQLAEGLRLRGWRVVVAHGGRQALALFQHDPTDAIVTDLHMPDGDGWTLLEKVHALAPDLPMVAVSTADGAELRRAVAAGAALTLRKPVSAGEIADALAEIQDQQW